VTVGETRWAPDLRFEPGAAAGLWQFSSQFTAASVVNYCVRNLDNLLVGRFLGPAALGFYSQAYQLMLYPVQYVAALAGRVMFPALASVQADRDRLRRGYLRALRGIAALTCPLMLGAMVLAPDLFAVLYGPRWERSVFLFQVLCCLGMVQSIGTTVGWIYLATGRTDLMLRWMLLAAAIILPGFVIGLRWGGLEGLVIGYALTSGLLMVPSLLPAFRLIRLPLGEAAARLVPLFAAAAGMAAVVLALRRLLLATHSLAMPWIETPLTRLLIGLAASIIVYPALLQAMGQAPLARVSQLWGALRSR
jgi:PST family polysaccharide transporter